MNKKRAIRWLGTLITLYITVGISIGFVSAFYTARHEYRDTSRLIGAISELYPELTDGLMQALKKSDADDFSAGNEVLKKYNYSQSTFLNRNASVMIGNAMFILLVPAVLLWIVWISQYKGQKARIDGLTAYLESVNSGGNTVLPRQEDDFSYLEDEIYKTVTELRQARENALQERQSLADNLADISHQLKTPITSMSLMTQLLADRQDEEAAVYVEKLEHQLNRLETLVSSLLTLSRLDAGILELEKKTVDVYEMLIRASEPIEETIRQKKQRLVIQSEAVSFYGDISWTAEAFLNIIKNCSEHTQEGGVILVCYANNPLYTEIIVEDNGEGFLKEDLAHIFERFYRGRTAAKDSIGIGLALSKSIISRQNGTIRAENVLKGGARFVIRFYQ